MNEKVAYYKDKTKELLDRYSPKQKWTLGIAAFIIFVLLIVITIQFTKTEYEIAFRDLNATDAAAIMKQLDQKKIDYQLSLDGKTIAVPSVDAARAKVDVGSLGIIHNGTLGLQMFGENSGFGSTDKEFNAKYNHALNGEIQQLLSRMEGIKEAKVMVNLPKESVFANEETEKASASILLTFESGFRPTQESVDAYYNLAKTAVPNLLLEDITISSVEGELAASAKGGLSGRMTNTIEEQMAVEKRFTNDIRNNVKSFLSKMIDPDKFDVLVKANLNFDKKNREEKLVTPVNVEDNEGIKISLQEIQKNYHGKGTAAGGVVGVGAQEVPNYPSSDGDMSTDSEELQRTINYDVNRITNQVVSSPYSVKDLTINVGLQPPTKNGEVGPEIKEAIQTILVNVVRASLADSGAIYTDEELMKKVSVMALNYQNVKPVNSSSWGTMQWVMLALGTLLVIGAIIGYIIYRKRKQEELLEEELEAFEVQDTPSPSNNTPENVTADLETMRNENQMRKQLESLARRKPEEFVSLLRTWLSDESR